MKKSAIRCVFPGKRLVLFGLWFWLMAGFGPARAAEDQTPGKADGRPVSGGSLAGLWEGKLEVGSISLRLVFHIEEKPGGTLSATMDSPDQGALGLPVERVGLQDGLVRLELKVAAAVFEGVLAPDGAEMKGKWKQGGGALPLTMRRTKQVSSLNRPQEPKEPFPYDALEVVVENKPGGVRLAGTLTLPREKRPCPAVVLLTGSGAQDRNESLLGHKPFLVLADYLTRRGVAVLRLDDRGVGGSTGDLSLSTSQDLAGDALCAVAFLQGRREIDPRRIGLVGHSEGGLIAPLAASQSKAVDFIVLLAGPGVPGDQILYRQGADIARAAGASEAEVEKQRRDQEAIFTVLRGVKDPAEREKQVRAIISRQIEELSAEKKKEQAPSKEYLEAQIKSVLSPWFLFFLDYDPRPALRKVRCPVLALNGEKDTQVAVDLNLGAIEQALRAGGNRQATCVRLPGLNHLFQHCRTGSPAEYGGIEETFSPDALQIVGDWIARRTGLSTTGKPAGQGQPPAEDAAKRESHGK